MARTYLSFADLASTIGRVPARKLLSRFGGGELSVPRPRRITAGHKIARAIGYDLAVILAREYGGEVLELAMGKAEMTAHNADLAQKGEISKAEAARRARVSVRWMRKLTNGCDHPGQGDLFNDPAE